MYGMRRRIHVCHMRRRIHACHMRRRIHACLASIIIPYKGYYYSTWLTPAVTNTLLEAEDKEAAEGTPP